MQLNHIISHPQQQPTCSSHPRTTPAALPSLSKGPRCCRSTVACAARSGPPPNRHSVLSRPYHHPNHPSPHPKPKGLLQRQLLQAHAAATAQPPPPQPHATPTAFHTLWARGLASALLAAAAITALFYCTCQWLVHTAAGGNLWAVVGAWAVLAEAPFFWWMQQRAAKYEAIQPQSQGPVNNDPMLNFRRVVERAK